jgi:arylsulfatase A-like enzyme
MLRKLSGVCLLIAGLAANAAPPNIIIIFTDDQGYEDIGCFGSPLIETPNLDRMAKEGMRFTGFYSASPVCSPSRAALLTGCYPTRVGVKGVFWPHNDFGLNPEEVTLAEVLKEKGYATACVGKWHLGHLPQFLPTAQGFDSYYGVPYSNDMNVDPEMAIAEDCVFREGMTEERMRTEDPPKNKVPLMRNEEVIEYPVDQSTLTQRYTKEALGFIRDHKEEPFFLYLPHTLPHVPLAASEDFRGKSMRGLYGDTIEEIDWSTGQILATLKELGIDENTLVIYTSDNGPWDLPNGQGGSAYPLRGFKFSTYEGGMRVPCIMRWPGKIPAGTTCDEVVGTIDLMPTIAKLTGAELPADRTLDGHDVWPLLADKEDAASPHDAYYYYRMNTLQSIRVGPWKFHMPGREPAELYNLAEDIDESDNRALEDADVAADMMARIKAFDEKLKEHVRALGRAGE